MSVRGIYKGNWVRVAFVLRVRFIFYRFFYVEESIR